MSEPREQSDDDAATAMVPSVKEIFEGLAVETGLSDTRYVDEEDAARDVARVMSAVRPLLVRYQSRYEELTRLLSETQANASAATVEARQISQSHLRTFERLEQSCVSLANEVKIAAATAADAGTPENTGSGGGVGEESATQRRLASAAEADALAARHRSLVRRRRRMRSALRVLEISERGRTALERKGSEPTGKRGARIEEAMKAIESLRDLLGEVGRDGAVIGSATDSRSSPPPSTVTRRGGTHANGDNDGDEAPRELTSIIADGELARVARGRLEWLVWRLRVHLSSDLASALRQADPLAAGGSSEMGGGRGQAGDAAGVSEVDEEHRREALARVKEAMRRLMALQFSGRPKTDPRPTFDIVGGEKVVGGGPGGRVAAAAMAAQAGRGDGAIWALDGLLEPVAVRFRFHFEEERPTNRKDRPEWFLSFLLRALQAYRPLLLQMGDVRPGSSTTAGKSEGGSGEGDKGPRGVEVEPLAYFARGLALLARRRLRAHLGAAAADPSLLSHTVEEALAFDRQLDEEVGYAECPARFPRQAWPRCVEVFAQDGERFERWMESDADAAKAKLDEAALATGAWRAVDWKNGPRSSMSVTPSALALCRIFSDITERYRPLRDPMKQLRFAKRVQEPVLRSYRDMLYRRGSDCRLHSVFRDGGGDQEATGAGAAGATSTTESRPSSWAVALDTALLGPGQEQDGDKSPIGRWRGYCLAVASCAYVCAVLRESEDDILFIEMGEAAAAAAAAAAQTGGGRTGMSPSLGAVGNVVGAAVGGVSQAVTSVATTAETATAGVVRAVGAQGSIIGPTHAISAALTTLKGAARRVRKAPSGQRSGSGGDGGGNLNGDIEEEQEERVGGDEEGEEEEEVNEKEGSGNAGVKEQARGLGEGVEGAEVGSGAGVRDGGVLPAAAVEIEEWTGSVFGEEAGRYEAMLETMLRSAVESCRDGFLWHTRSYLRAWDRGIAVVLPLVDRRSVPSTTVVMAAEASGRLGAGVELLETAVEVAEQCLPPAQLHKFWAALASELDLTLVKQIVARRSEMTQDEGLQIAADLKVLMTPFDKLARRRPENYFPSLAEAAVLLSLEKSQLRSLSSGLDAHGGGVAETARGGGWDGWREEGGSLSPEGTQMRDMLENVGVRRLGPAEASILLEKRLRGDRLAVLGHLSAVSGDGGGGVGGGGGRLSPTSSFAREEEKEGGAGLVRSGPADSGTFEPDGVCGDPSRGAVQSVDRASGAVGRAAVPSFG